MARQVFERVFLSPDKKPPARIIDVLSAAEAQQLRLDSLALPKGEKRIFLEKEKRRYQEFCQRLEQDSEENYPVFADLLASLEAPALDLSWDEVQDCQLSLEAEVKDLQEIRQQKGEDEMLKAVLERAYSVPYADQQNTLLKTFGKSATANCIAFMKRIGVILEKLGYNPQTEIAVQYFIKHQRILLKRGDQWWVMESKTPYLLDRDDISGTVVIFLNDQKRRHAGLAERERVFGAELNQDLPKNFDEDTGNYIVDPGGMDHRHVTREYIPGSIEAKNGFFSSISVKNFFRSVKRHPKFWALGTAASFLFSGMVKNCEPKIADVDDYKEQVSENLKQAQDFVELVVQEMRDFLKLSQSSVPDKNNTTNQELFSAGGGVDQKSVPLSLEEMDPQAFAAYLKREQEITRDYFTLEDLFNLDQEKAVEVFSAVVPTKKEVIIRVPPGKKYIGAEILRYIGLVNQRTNRFNWPGILHDKEPKEIDNINFFGDDLQPLSAYPQGVFSNIFRFSTDIFINDEELITPIMANSHNEESAVFQKPAAEESTFSMEELKPLLTVSPQDMREYVEKNKLQIIFGSEPGFWNIFKKIVVVICHLPEDKVSITPDTWRYIFSKMTDGLEQKNPGKFFEKFDHGTWAELRLKRIDMHFTGKDLQFTADEIYDALFTHNPKFEGLGLRPVDDPNIAPLKIFLNDTLVLDLNTYQRPNPQPHLKYDPSIKTK